MYGKIFDLDRIFSQSLDSSTLNLSPFYLLAFRLVLVLSMSRLFALTSEKLRRTIDKCMTD
jgi:hypothetical protein